MSGVYASRSLQRSYSKVVRSLAAGQRSSLSTSANERIIRPESPEYIQVPEAIQAPKAPLPKIKGILPTGRAIITRRKQYKARAEWLNQSAPAPKGQESDDLSDSSRLDRAAHRSRMAELRRSNLRQGMSELHGRFVARQQVQEKRKEHAILRRLKAQDLPERYDEEWTQPSVPSAIKLLLESKDNSRRESVESQNGRRERYLQYHGTRMAENLESIHALYLNARDFILTEERLEQEIESIFGPDDVPASWAGSHRSIWSLGPPPGTEQLTGNMPDMATDLARGTNFESMNEIMRTRMLRITGQLTGGEIPISPEMAKRAARSKQGLF